MAVTDFKNEGITEDSNVQEYMGEKHHDVEEGGLSDPNHVELQRALKARHITMIGMSANFEPFHKSKTNDHSKPSVVPSELVSLSEQERHSQSTFHLD